jgi:hypothetical protein
LNNLLTREYVFISQRWQLTMTALIVRRSLAAPRLQRPSTALPVFDVINLVSSDVAAVGAVIQEFFRAVFSPFVAFPFHFHAARLFDSHAHHTRSLARTHAHTHTRTHVYVGFKL